MVLGIIGMAQAASRPPVIQVVHLVHLQAEAAAITSIGIRLHVAVAVMVLVAVVVLIALIRVAAAADPELTLTGVVVAVGPILRVVALLHPGVAALVLGIVVRVIANIQHILAVVHILVQEVVRVIHQVAAVEVIVGMTTQLVPVALQVVHQVVPIMVALALVNHHPVAVALIAGMIIARVHANQVVLLVEPVADPLAQPAVLVLQVITG